MRTETKTKLGIGMAAACTTLLAASAAAQNAIPAAASPAPAVMLSSSSQAAKSIEVVRVIDDPSTGVRWLLVRDLSHPSGPGRMVRSAEFQGSLAGDSSSATAHGGSLPAAFRPVIRMGDRLIVEEHSAVADASLEAVALNSANLGAPLEVRLRMGGKILRALATGPGHATLQSIEVKP